MMTMLLPALGAYLGHRSFKRFSLWLIAAMVVFSTLQNANAVARWAEADADSRQIVLTVPDRLELLFNTTFTEVEIETYLPLAKHGVETWWLRLNYSGPQAAAMALYDQGISGGFTQNVFVYLVPRVLWPEKPSIVSPGREFHALWTGRNYTNTKVGITVFADGYLQMGWFGLGLFSGVMGLVFGTLARLTMNQLDRRQFLYLPAAMLGLQMGATSTTAFLQNTILAGLPVYFGYCGVVYVVYFLFAQISANQQISLAAHGRKVRPAFNAAEKTRA